MAYVRSSIASKSLAVGALAIVLQVFTPSAQADSIDPYRDGSWLMFTWAPWLGEVARGCRPADPGGLPCNPYSDKITPAPAPPWTFTMPAEGGGVDGSRLRLVGGLV